MEDQTNFIYRTIISDMSEGLMVIGLDGIITHLNPAAEAILGKSRESLIGKKFARSFFLYEENDSFNQAIIDAIYDRNNSHRNIVAYFDGKNTRHLQITTSYLRNNGEKIGIVVVLSDISELLELRDAIKAMEHIKKLNDQLSMRNKLLSATFGRYLSDEIVKELLDTPGGLQLGGKKRSVTIMMSDLRGFTVMSENMDANDLITMLNHYLTVMGEIIAKYKGTIIEFLGDGILIVFGAPIVVEEHALNAVCTAVEMQAAMPKVNEWNREHGYPDLQMGIGINSGETIVGNIGSERCTKYGVIGRKVNLCGRIESYTVGGQILISPETKASIKEPLEIFNEFSVLPKGLKDPIVLSEITGVGGSIDIHCPTEAVKEFTYFDKPVDVEFFIIEDKHCGSEALKAKVVAFADYSILLETDEELELFTNIEIHYTDVLYGKITKSEGKRYFVSITSTPQKLNFLVDPCRK